MVLFGLLINTGILHPDEEIEEVVVTGSQIKGAKITGVLPVTILSSDDIDAIGPEDGTELMENIAEQGVNYFTEAESDSGGENSAGTDPDEAAKFARETGVDAMAISVGNVHLQQDKEGGLDERRIRAIEALTDCPLVIHGGSGVPMAQRMALAQGSQICKFNIGTELRMAFGSALRAAVAADPARFDRVAILKDTHDPLVAAARQVLRGFKPASR